MTTFDTSRATSGAGETAAGCGVGDAFRDDLLALRGLEPGRIRSYLDAAKRFAPIANRSDVKGEELKGKVVANLFFEASTRTRVSFTLAAQRLSGDVVDLSEAGSSVGKGESLVDTALTIQAMGVDGMIVRARQAGAARLVAQAVDCPVINAGDGKHEHPTQGLLDIYTLSEALGRMEGWDLSGVRIAIVGDVVSSRVARSAIAGMGALGAKVVCVGPVSLAPKSMETLGCGVHHDLDEVLSEVDAVMMLRVQFERHGGGGGGGSSIVSAREYRNGYALTDERAAKLKAGAVVLHPGPMNRGLEIDPGVADSGRALVLAQVANGVAVRMGVLGEALGTRL